MTIVNSKDGVTLVELLLVVTIVMIISVSAPVFYSRFLTQNAVSNATDQIVQTLRKAQFYAMMSRKSNTGGWGVYYSGTVIIMYQGSSYAGHPNSALDERFTLSNNQVSISPNPFEVNFARITGLPSATPAVTVGGLNMTKTVTVNAQGMVSR